MTISVRTGLASRVPQGTGIVSIRTVANRLHLPYPSTLRDMVGLLEPIKIHHQFNAATCSGSCELTMTNDGVVHYTGKVHDSGALAASYVAITSFPTLTDSTTYPPAIAGLVWPVVVGNKGHVGGTFSFDSRDDTWNKTGTDPRIAENWAGVKAAAASARTDFGTDTGAIDLLDGLVNAATGTFVFSL